jgi:hypothetical protein
MASTEAGTDARVGCPATSWQHLYARHKPETTPLYPIIEEHAPRFFAELREQGASLPRSLRPSSSTTFAVGDSSMAL